MADVIGKLGDAAGLMAFAATVRSDVVRREMEDRATQIFWQSVQRASWRSRAHRPEMG